VVIKKIATVFCWQNIGGNFMKQKKITAIVLSIVMMLGICQETTFAEDILEAEPILNEIEEQTQETKSNPQTVLDNIAKKYSSYEICQDENMPWFLADLGSYYKLYPNSNNRLSNETIQCCMDRLIELAKETAKPSDLAKVIIAMRAMGYEPKNVYDKTSLHIDVTEKLLKLVDEKSDYVTNIYTLPYVIIALREYATTEQMLYLVDSAIDRKAEWQDTTYGPDGATPMMLALSDYYDTYSDVKDAVDEIVPIVKATQNEMGLIDSWGAAASTGLAIAGFSALGIDSETIVNNDNTLIDGLMSEVNLDSNGFLPIENSFSTEQGFRGLVAWQLYKNDKKLYDFSDNDKNILYATQAKRGGGKSNKIKEQTQEVIKEVEKVPEQETEKEIEKDTKQDAENVNEKTISFFDVKEAAWYYDSVNFVLENKLMSGTDIGFEPELFVTRAMITAMLYRMEEPQKNDDENVFSDVEKGSWYYDAVAWAWKNGIVSGIDEHSFAPNDNVTREQIVVLLYRYVKFKGIDTEKIENSKTMMYNDVNEISSYAATAMKWAVGGGLIKGETDTTLNPKSNTTRAQIATILMRFCQMQGEN